ncbi:MAG TPA: serine hydrolase [Candidatus Angelobacter sp.]|nr:serine hydrolase [Candidatus Angelobacter sp.]
MHRTCKVRFLSSLTIIALFVALAGTAEAQWQARHNLTPAQFQTTFDDLFKQGYRLKCISGYVSGGSERYAGLWVKANGPAWQARNGMSAADYQKAFDDFFKQGYRLTWVSAHEVGGTTKYEAIWEQKPGPAWQAKHGMTAAEYQQAFDTFFNQGYRMIHVSGYNSGGSAHFAAIWEKSGGPAWQAKHNLTFDQYQQAFTSFSNQGYRLKDISGYNVGGTDYFAAIWEKTNGPWWWARHGIPDAWYQNVFDNFYYQGYQPALITAFTSGSAGKLNGIWDNTNFSANDLQLISSQMQSYMSANNVPGAALAITKDGRLVYAAGFGRANQETGEEAGPTNLFRIASVSKPVTSIAIMKLIESGSLHLTDKVFGPGSILGAQFPTPPNNKKIEQITVKYLLEHVSGLSNAGGDPMFMNLNMNHAQLISWVLNDPPHFMTRDANTQEEYLNFGFCLLGRIIEKKSGMSYEQFVKQNVLTPSGITNMVIGANTEAAHKPREVKYYPSNAYSLNVTRFDSHGGWVASPIDLVRFIVRVDGLPTKPDIISSASHTAMTTDSGIKDANNNDPNYGFGWGLPQWHNGAMDGTIAFLQVLPNGYTYSVVANTRPANDGFAFNMSGVVQNIVKGVSKWPAYDLF